MANKKRIKGIIDGIRITNNDTVEVFIEGHDDAIYVPRIFAEEVTDENVESFIGGVATVRYSIDGAGTEILIGKNADGTMPVTTVSGIIVKRKDDEGKDVSVELAEGEAYQEGDKVVLRMPKVNVQMASFVKSKEQLENVKLEDEVALLRAKMTSIMGGTSL